MLQGKNSMPNNNYLYFLLVVVILLGAAIVYNSWSINTLTDMFTDQVYINRKILDMFEEILR